MRGGGEDLGGESGLEGLGDEAAEETERGGTGGVGESAEHKSGEGTGFFSPAAADVHDEGVQAGARIARMFFSRSLRSM